MKTKTLKTTICLTLAFCFMVICSATAVARAKAPSVDNVISTNSTIIGTCSASLTINGSSATIYAYQRSSSATNVTIKAYLQKKSGSSYVNVKTWSATQPGSTVSLSKTQAITSSSSYRLKVVFTATNGSNTESSTLYKYA